MENPKPEEQNILKDIRNLFWLERLKQETIYTTIIDIKNLFRLWTKNKAIKDNHSCFKKIIYFFHNI